jgi:hypothetical protein
MGRLNQIKIGVDALTEARLTVRAQRAGATLSEYVRGLILRDLSRADDRVTDSADGSLAKPPADALTAQLLEVALVTGILVRAQLARTIGEGPARDIESRAQEKAAVHMNALLGEADVARDPASEGDSTS